MSEVRERLNFFDLCWKIKAGNSVDESETFIYFVLDNNWLERNFRFDVAFKRIARDEFN